MMQIKTICLLILILVLRPVDLVRSQVPVGAVYDAGLAIPNTITSLAEIVTNLLLDDEKSLQENISNVQKFFHKANTVVNGAVTNMKMIKKIVEMEIEIKELYQQSVNKLNTPIDADGDGVDDLEVLDKWKEIQVLLAFTKELSSIFEIFTNLIEDDAFTMNDKGRIVLIEKTYVDLRILKAAMKGHIRRMNRKVYAYRVKKRQLKMYSFFFE